MATKKQSVLDPEQFVALGPDGQPSGKPVIPGRAGRVGPCEWRPCGSLPSGGAAVLALRLSEGGSVVGSGATLRLRFPNLAVVGSRDGLVRLRGTLRTDISGEVAIGPLEVAALTELLGLPAVDGLPVSLCQTFDARLTAGRFTTDGLVEPCFVIEQGSLPFGSRLGARPGLTVDLRGRGSITLPLSGRFGLGADAAVALGAGSGITLTIDDARPAWVRLDLEGTWAVAGEARLQIPAFDATFDVALAADGPRLRLAVQGRARAASVAIALPAPELPEAATAVPAASANSERFAKAALVTRRKAKLFARYAAAFGGGLGVDEALAQRPTLAELLGLRRMLSATAIGGSMPGFAEAVAEASRQAAVATTVVEAAQAWWALERLRLVGFDASVLAHGLGEAGAGLQRLLSAAEQPLSMTELQALFATAAERSKLAQERSFAIDDTAMQAALQGALDNTLQAFAMQLDVKPGVFEAAAGSPLLQRHRFLLLQDLHTLTIVQREAQTLALAIRDIAPWTEMLSQIGMHLASMLTTQLDDAQGKDDELAFEEALVDLAELIAFDQAGLFGSKRPSLPEWPALAERWTFVSLRAAGQPAAVRPLARWLARVHRVGPLLDSVPAGVTYPSASLRRAYDALLAALRLAIPPLQGTSGNDLHALLYAGIAAARLRDRLGFPDSKPAWESPARLGAVVAALAQRCLQDDDHDMALKAVTRLLDEADRALAALQSDRCRRYLQEAQKLVITLRGVGVARQSHFASPSAELSLAGACVLEDAAGGFSIDTGGRRLAGWALGRLRVPGCGGQLTVSRLTFDHDESFELEAHGSLLFPSASEPVARLSVTPARPLQWRWRDGRLTLAGGALIDVAGASFEAWLTLDGPKLVAGARARGLDFDLGQKMRVMVPSLPATTPVAAAVQRDLNACHAALGEAMTGLIDASAAAVPAVAAPATASPFAALEAAVRATVVQLQRGVAIAAPDALFGPVQAKLRQLAVELSRRESDGSCRTLAARRQTHAALRLVMEARKLKQLPTRDARTAMLLEQADELERALTPLIACLRKGAASDSLADDTEHLALMREFVAGDGTLETLFETARYVVDTWSQRLQSAGLDPATGKAPAGSTPGVAARLPALGERTGRLMLSNLALRTELLQRAQHEGVLPAAVSEGVVSGGVAVATAAMANLGVTASSRVVAAMWDGLIEEGRALVADRPAPRPTGGPGSTVLLSHPACVFARAYGRRLRIWWQRALGLELLHEMYGAPDLVVSHIDRPDGPWASDWRADAYEVVERMLIQEVDAYRPDYGPVVGRVYWRTQPGQRRIPLKSRPFIEGWMGLDEPFAATQIRNPSGYAFLDIVARPPADNAAALAAWKSWRAASLGLLPDAVVVPGDLLETLLAGAQGRVCEFLEHADALGGLRLAHLLRALILQAQQGGAAALASAAQQTLTQLDAGLRSLAASQRTWWVLAAYAELLVDAAEHSALRQATALGSFFEQLGRQALSTGFAIINDLSALLPGQRPADVLLPGALSIDEVFGELTIDTQAKLLRGSFGGTLSLSDLGVHAAVRQATIDNQGRLAIEALLDGPVPGAPGVTVEGTLQASGRYRLGAAGLPTLALEPLSLSGSASVTLPDSTHFSGSMAWSADTGTFEVGASGEHVDLCFGDALVLLSGGITVRLQRPASTAGTVVARLELRGSAGLLARATPAAGRSLTAADFHLALQDATIRLDTADDRVTLTVTSGTLLLPDAFGSGEGAARRRAELGIDAADPPTLLLLMGPANAQGGRALSSARLGGVLNFSQLGLAVPGFDMVGARGLAGSLDFGRIALGVGSGAVRIGDAPALRIDSGELFLPQPLVDGEIIVGLHQVQWRLDGWPVGTLRLATDVTLLTTSGLTVELVGADDSDRTGLELIAPIVPQMPPALRLFGELRVLVDSSVLAAAEQGLARAAGPALAAAVVPAGRVGGCARGELRLQPRPGGASPQVSLSLPEIIFEGDFCLGGQGGVRVHGNAAGERASVRISNPGGLLALDDTPGGQVVVTINGQVGDAGMPAFGLADTQLVFRSPTRPPRLVPGALVYDGSDWELTQHLPASLDSAVLRLKNPDLPLRELLRPGNVEITCSFRIGLPTLEDPVLGGGAEGVVVDFGDNGEPRLRNLDGIELTLSPGLKIPPIEDLGGSLYLSGLQTPQRLLLAGRVGGSVNGYKLTFIAAFTPTGPLGLAVDFNAGSVGIPLGPTGFLFTGAAGGISFLNTMSDPMTLKGYLRESTQPKGFTANTAEPPPAATMDWAGFKKWRDTLLAQVPVFPPLGSGPVISMRSAGDDPPGDPIGCPVDVPPPSANILGMPHPDQGRFPGLYVLKFSAIPEATLNKPVARGGMGITKESIATLRQRSQNLAVQLADLIVDRLRRQVPPVPAQLGPGARQAVEGLWVDVHDGLQSAFDEGIRSLDSHAADQAVYEIIRDRAWAGVPVKDATLAVKGVFTHTCVSAFFNVEGYGTIGSVGSAGVGGRINLLGVPVGHAALYLSATDVNGNPNPQVTGSAIITLGPLQFGELTVALKADGAVTGVAAVIANLVTTLGEGLTGELLGAVDPVLAGATLARAETIVSERGNSPARKALAVAMLHQAFVGQVLQRLAQGLLADKADAVARCIAGLIDQIKPEFVACGEASVRFAGLKLADGFYRLKFRERIVERSGFREGTVEAYFGGNPATCIGYGTPIMLLTAGVDHASFQYAETVPDVAGLIKSLLLRRIDGPQQMQELAREQLRRVLENSTITGTYELHPLGFDVARAQARIINPDLTLHPVVRRHDPALADWVRPGIGAAAKLPSREDLLMAAVRSDKLGNVFWKGRSEELAALFPAREALRGKTLSRDYFPHGGLVLAAMLFVPRIFTTLPRGEWATLVGGGESKERFDALVKIVREYLVGAVQVGQFTAYVPCPNPPALFNADGTAIVPPPSLDPLALVESLKTFDPEKARTGALWELGESFAFFHLSGTLLDIPVGEVCLAAAGPNPATGEPAMFSGRVTVPPDSWVAALYGSVDLTVKIAAQAREPRRTLADALRGPRGRLDQFRGGASPSTPAPADFAQLAREVIDLVQRDLPRVEISAQARLLTDPLGIPMASHLGARDLVTLTAYSPGWLPMLPVSPTPLQLLQHLGGIAMSGTWSLASMLSLRGMVLIEPPLAAGQLPRLVASLSGDTSLPVPGAAAALALAEVEAQFDSQSAQFLRATASVSAVLPLTVAGGWPVTIPVGARVTVENHRATIRFECNGSAALLAVDLSDPQKPTVVFSGTLVLPTVKTGVLSLLPLPGASQIRVDVGPGGARATGARLQVGGPIGLTLTLPAFDLTFPATVTTPVSAVLPAATVGGLGLERLQMSLTLDRGKLAVPGFSAWLPADRLFPGMPDCQLVGGALGGDGGFTLAGQLPSLPFGRMALAGPGGAQVPLSLTPTGLAMKIGAIDMPGLFPAPWKPAQPFSITWPASPTDDVVLATVAAAPVLGGHRFDETEVVLERRGGQVQLRIDSARLRAGPLTLPGRFAGTVSSSGEFKFYAKLDDEPLFGFPASGALTLANSDLAAALESLPPPAAWWRLDAVSGLSVADVSGKGRAGSAPQTAQAARLETPTKVPLPWPLAPPALLFDGVDDHFIVPHHPDLAGSTALTISAWFRVKAFTRPWQTIISKGDSAWRLARHGDSATIAFDSTHANGGVHVLAAKSRVDDDRWHHVAVVFDGNRKLLYLDGKIEASAGVAVPIATNTFPVMLGANAQAAGRHWPGALAEVVFWPVALPEAALPGLAKLPTRLGVPRLSLWARVNLLGNRDNVPGAWRPTFSGEVSPSGAFRLTADGPGSALLGFPFQDLKLEFERTEGAQVARLSGSGTLTPPPKPPGAPFPALTTGPSFDMVFSHSNGQTRLQASASIGGGRFCGFQVSPGERMSVVLAGLLGNSGAITFSNLRLTDSALSDWRLPALAGVIRPDGAIESPPLALPERMLGGWKLRSVTARFNGVGLEVGGSLAIVLSKPPLPPSDFGEITLQGLLTSDGRGLLKGRGRLKIGGCTTDETGFSIDLGKPDRLLPESTLLLGYSGLKLPMNDFLLKPDSFSASIERRFPEGNARVTVHTCHWADDLKNPRSMQSHLKVEFDGRVTLNYDLAQRSLTRKLNGSLDWSAENLIPARLPGELWPTSGHVDLHAGNLALTVNGEFVIAGIEKLPSWLNKEFRELKFPFG